MIAAVQNCRKGARPKGSDPSIHRVCPGVGRLSSAPGRQRAFGLYVTVDMFIPQF